MTKPKTWHLCREVATGRFADFEKLYARKKTLAARTEKAVSYWVVIAWECRDCPSCDGYEVCLHEHTAYPNGGGYKSPVWPILSCRTPEEAEEWLTKLMRFARTIEPGIEHRHFDKEINGDKRLAVWLTEQGWERFNHITWKRKG